MGEELSFLRKSCCSQLVLLKAELEIVVPELLATTNGALVMTSLHDQIRQMRFSRKPCGPGIPNMSIYFQTLYMNIKSTEAHKVLFLL